MGATDHGGMRVLRIRLRRAGKKGKAHYRLVVADQRAPRDGAFLESLGSYDPHQEPPLATLDADRARDWLAKGAQPSEAAAKILRRAGVLAGAPATAVATAAPAAAAPAAASVDETEAEAAPAVAETAEG